MHLLKVKKQLMLWEWAIDGFPGQMCKFMPNGTIDLYKGSKFKRQRFTYHLFQRGEDVVMRILPPWHQNHGELKVEEIKNEMKLTSLMDPTDVIKIKRLTVK